MATGTSLRAAVVTIVIAASWTASHRAAAAADALIANPRTQPITITASDLGSHSVALGVGKSVVIDLPHDIKDVLVGDPKIANAVIRSARRAYIVGNGVGQTNVYFFDAEGRQMAGFDIAVTRDLNGIRAAIRQVLPEADIRVEGIGEGVVLSGTASSQAEAQQAYDIAVRLLGAGTADTVSLGSKVVNAIIVRGRDQIMLKVTVAEVERDIVKQLGINLSGTLGYGTAVVNFNNTNPSSASGQPLSASNITGGWQNISATIQAMEQDSHARRAESDGDFRGNRDLRRRRRIPRPQWLLLHGRQQRHCARECSVGLSTLDPVQEVRREPQLHAGRSQRGPHQH
jgi:pilus assembly protein CpaC